MKVYRITVSYCDRHGHPCSFTRIYAARNFDLAVNYAKSVTDNAHIPGDAKYAVVNSAESLGPVSVIGSPAHPEPLPPTPEPDDTTVNDYKEFCRDLKDWVNSNPQWRDV